MKNEECTLPAAAKCKMKKFILDFLVLPPSRVIMTKEFPAMITDRRIHKNISCSD